MEYDSFDCVVRLHSMRFMKEPFVFTSRQFKLAAVSTLTCGMDVAARSRVAGYRYEVNLCI